MNGGKIALQQFLPHPLFVFGLVTLRQLACRINVGASPYRGPLVYCKAKESSEFRRIVY